MRRGATRSTCPPCAVWSTGRALLFPPDGDVAAAVDIAAGLVHGSGVGGVSDNERWVRPLRERPHTEWSVAIDDAVDGWSHTRLYAAELVPGQSRTVAAASGSTSSCRWRDRSP